MQDKELRFKKIVDSIVEIFSELESIVQAIKDDFTEERKLDPRLTMNIVDQCLGIVSNRLNLFKSSRKIEESKWPFEKDIKYLHDRIRSFYREFDNPFLGSQRWYQRIRQLEDQLSEQSSELEKLIEQK